MRSTFFQASGRRHRRGRRPRRHDTNAATLRPGQHQRGDGADEPGPATTSPRRRCDHATPAGQRRPNPARLLIVTETVTPGWFPDRCSE